MAGAEAVGAADVLAAVAGAVGSRMDVLFDSGVRSRAEVFKALALGARAVLVGRPPDSSRAGPALGAVVAPTRTARTRTVRRTSHLRVRCHIRRPRSRHSCEHPHPQPPRDLPRPPDRPNPWSSSTGVPTTRCRVRRGGGSGLIERLP
ncbi:alpha-hydroxy-acid oxidizing protein [Streptomyces sp. NPDC087212]|uniref:alpha-hydroxy-acid oxidizing protein n=1 Tax=Streptomyces sp. NPDC087212 TaxID=3365766 RepID=UPI0037FFBA96